MRDDPRFKVDNNKIFKPIKKEKFKVQLDDRFKGILADEKFQSVVSTGKTSQNKTIKNKKGKNAMSEFYTIEGEEENDRNVTTNKNKESSAPGGGNNNKKKGGGKGVEDRLTYLTKLARGEVSGESSSDESDNERSLVGDDLSDEEDDDENLETENDNAQGSVLGNPENDDEAIPIGDASSRLAIMNCDWQNLKASDLMMVLQSFCPAGTALKSVTVYPSDFGLKAMEIESSVGPQGIWNQITVEKDINDDEDEDEDIYDTIEENTVKLNAKNVDGEFHRGDGQDSKAVGVVFHSELRRRGLANDDDDNDSAVEGNEDEDDESVLSEERAPTSTKKNNNKKKEKKQSAVEKGGGFNKEALRAYELTKLKYYFAIVECDSIATASILYERMDGLEFEHSSLSFDLRFVPPETSFEGRQVRDTCYGTEVAALAARYIPPDFVVKALQHTNVECTWDDDEKERTSKLGNISKWRMLQESDFQKYLASDDSESENDEKINKIRNLLLGGGDHRHDKDSNEEEEEEDDFFAPNEDRSDGSEDNDVDKVATFVPDLKNEIKGKLQSKSNTEETPFETQLRKMSEAKKKKKNLRKSANNNGGDDDEMVQIDPKLDLMFDEEIVENPNEYNMRDIEKNEKDKKKRKKRKSSSTLKDGDTSTTAVDDAFDVDLEDSRFAGLLSKDGRYGIDPSSSEFHATPAMKKILREQRKRSKLLSKEE